jgi:AcrR family transcriptional regulator
MSEKDTNTEQRILEAAKKIFIVKGRDGARMQEIADEAGINKSLLHYYYRSKDKLFEAVLTEAFKGILPDVAALMTGQKSVFEKIRLFAASYIESINQNPLLPTFVIHELGRDPMTIARLIKSSGINPLPFINQVQEEIKDGKINPIDPFHLIINLIAMCIFPFVARPILQHVIFNDDNQIFDSFIEQRKTEIPEFIINSIEKR